MSELISVEFRDQTNYTAYQGSDVGGMVIDHVWGPVGVRNVLTRSQFLNYYPESVPFNVTSSYKPTWLEPFANAKLAFDRGAAAIEVVRAEPHYNFSGFYWKGDGTANCGQFTFTDSKTGTETYEVLIPGVTKIQGAKLTLTRVSANKATGVGDWTVIKDGVLLS